ncbi:MAG TPA: VOC family protein [Terracidiphilus sp.]|nr:VOC family protein [Terracidiphilus sp.]
MNKPITWFEIPTLDLSRAKSFYQQILGVSLRDEAIGSSRLAIFPYNRENSTGGCLIHDEDYHPGSKGPVVYLNAGSSLNAALNLVNQAGGTVLLPETVLPAGMGSYAHILDTEGNRVGLHSATA